MKAAVERMSFFPYLKSPTEHTSEKYYSRVNNEFLESRFSNCVERAIFYFLNCLLWNPVEGKYSLKEEHKNTSVYKFFNGKKMISNLNQEQIDEWHMIVEDLPGVGTLKTNFKTFEEKFNHVVYIMK